MENVVAPAWRKSSRCANATCVEVAQVNGEYLIRDSKNPDAATLSFSAEEWVAFKQGVSAGDFDSL